MTSYAQENLLRLMASAGLSQRQVVERTGLNARTVRGIIRGGHKPHARTLHRLSKGLGVKIDEFFVDPAQLLYRRFDPRTNPVVAKVVEEHRELFHKWTEADFDALHNRVDEGSELTAEGTLDAVRHKNRKRELHEKFDVLLESDYAEVAAGVLDVLYQKTVGSG